MDFGVIFDNTLTALFNAEALYLALAAIGLNVHFGYTGLLNFGQVGFVAIAAYGLGTGVTYFDLPFGVSLLLGLGGAVVLALLLGIPTLRLRADYLAIVTIASSEALRLIFRSATLRDVSGGSSGLTGFAEGFYALNPLAPGQYRLGPVDYDANRLWLLIVGWTVVLLISLLVFLLMRSPWGRVLRAIREDEDAARALGKNVYSYKMQSLVLGGLFGALGGMIYALGTGSAQPDQYQNANTFLAYGALILGGAARVSGPVIGAMLLWFIIAFSDSALSALLAGDRTFFGLFQINEFVTQTDVAYARFIIIGLGIMFLMIFRPQGIFGDRREVMLDAR